jgi:hypothetical protein
MLWQKLGNSRRRKTHNEGSMRGGAAGGMEVGEGGGRRRKRRQRRRLTLPQREHSEGILYILLCYYKAAEKRQSFRENVYEEAWKTFSESYS